MGSSQRSCISERHKVDPRVMKESPVCYRCWSGTIRYKTLTLNRRWTSRLINTSCSFQKPCVSYKKHLALYRPVDKQSHLNQSFYMRFKVETITICVNETQMPTIIVNSKDGQDQKDNYLETIWNILSQKILTCNMNVFII